MTRLIATTALCLTLAFGAPALAQTPGPAEVIADLYKPVVVTGPEAEVIEEAPEEPPLFAASLRALLAAVLARGTTVLKRAASRSLAKNH